VDQVIPFAGYVVRYARSPFGALVLIVLPVVGLTLDYRARKNHPIRVRPAERRRRRRSPIPDDVGWSTTTYHLVWVTPRSLRSDPGG
jgi:hypothetical protein